MLDRIPRPVFVMALLAVLALGLALGANAFVARKLSVSPERLAAARAGAPAPRSATADPGPSQEGREEAVATANANRRTPPRRLDFWLNPIVKRNIFDAENALMGKPDEPEEEVLEAGGQVDRESDIAATLVSTSVAMEPIWSTALISTDEGTEVYRVEEKILDGVIKEIHRPTSERPARIILLRNGVLEFLAVGGSGGKKSSARPTKSAAKPKAASGAHEWGEVKSTGDNSFELPQEDVEYALGNLDKLAREARVVPNFADGKTNGFKVFAIRRNSIFRQMGLKNNDVLTGVNGFDLSNTDKALELYSKLASEKSFSVEVLRNGEPVTLEYEVK